MTGITLRVLDGADRGRVFENLVPPITIGREEGNTIQLNDERISRYHIKIQEDHDKLVVTDLESTNGTKVNGEDIQLRILRFGDTITVGKSVLLFGSRDQIALRLAKLRAEESDINAATMDPAQLSKAAEVSSLDFELNWNEDNEVQATLHALEPPEIPARMSPGQAAQLAEMLEYLHVKLRNLIGAVRVDSRSQQVTLDFRQWQAILELQARVAEYIRQIGNT
ncbi:MAG: FHA domain-containing protein [Planctomycetaceae bacterium]